MNEWIIPNVIDYSEQAFLTEQPGTNFGPYQISVMELFLQESQRLKAIDYFCKKNSFIDAY